MTFVKECEKEFGTSDLYAVLGLDSKKASAAEVKKAYYRQSMKWHPDRFAKDATDSHEAKNATTKFQILGRAYAILSDKEKRVVYDETGAIDEEGVLEGGEGFEETMRLWRTIFKKVTPEEIDNYMKKYKGSEEEKADIITSYNRRGGDMNLMSEEIIGWDEKETAEIVEQLIQEGVLKRTKKWEKTTSKAASGARKKTATREAKEAERVMKEIVKKEGTDDLQALILARNVQRARGMDDFADMLAKKYGGGSGEPKAKKARKGK